MPASEQREFYETDFGGAFRPARIGSGWLCFVLKTRRLASTGRSGVLVVVVSVGRVCRRALPAQRNFFGRCGHSRIAARDLWPGPRAGRALGHGSTPISSLCAGPVATRAGARSTRTLATARTVSGQRSAFRPTGDL